MELNTLGNVQRGERMSSRVLLIALGPLLFLGCATPPPDPAQSTAHPANANATVEPLPPSAGVLTAGLQDSSGRASEPSRVGHEGHGQTSGNRPGDNSAHRGHAEHGPATATQAPASRPATQPGGQTYTCPHHPEVVSTEPGKCPKCGMQLVPTKPKSKAQSRPSSAPAERSNSGHGDHH